MFNSYFCYPFYLPTWNTKPPTLYSIMNSIANFGKEDKTKIKDLAKASREKIFNFTYPLSSKVKKEDFEKMILNKFMKRRIGFETVTDFRIHLDVKLNEIMPLYNKMFDVLEGWDIFNDGDITVRTGTDDRNINNTVIENNDTIHKEKNNIIHDERNNTSHEENRIVNSNTSNNLINKSTTTGNNISDLRFSNTPQNELQNVKDGKYITQYNYNQDNNSSEDNSTSNGESTSTNNDDINYTNNVDINYTNNVDRNYTNNIDKNTTNNTKDNNEYNETIIHSPSDKIAIYKQFQQDLQNIYTLIFKDLDCLFYQLIDE